MFTDNYLKYRRMMFGVSSSLSMKDFTNTTKTAYAQYSYNSDFASNTTGRCCEPSTSYPGVYFGSGDTAPTLSDYKLASVIQTGLSITSSGGVVADRGNGTYEYSMAFIVRNSSEEEITIAEMGVFTKMGSSSSASGLIMIERQVLPIPIVLAPGERKLITYKITINQTLHVD